MKKILSLSFVSFMLLTTASFAADAAIENGKLVKFNYTLTVNKEQIETSEGKEPLSFIVGSQSVIPGLEKGMIGMRVGEEKVIVVEPKEAYGLEDPNAFKEFPLSMMPANAKPTVGMVLQAQAPDGESFPATIAEIKGDKVKLNFNHPLAGKQLEFKVKVVDIAAAPVAKQSSAVPVPVKK